MSQHIVNVSFDFDEDRVRTMIEDNAKQMVIDKITTDIERSIVSNYGYYDKNKRPSYSDVRAGLKSMAYNELDEFLEKNKDLIIETAADKLADRLSRTKAAKELKNKTVVNK